MSNILFHNLETPLLQFKQMVMEDVQAIHTYASDEDVSRFIGWPLMKSIEETEDFVTEMMAKEVSGTHIYANIIEKRTNEVIGTVMIFNIDPIANKAEVGYVFRKDTWGRGYCSEALEKICDHGFKVLDLHKIHAQVTDSNIGSSRVLEKNKFIKEGHLKDHYYIDNQYFDCLLYGRIK